MQDSQHQDTHPAPDGWDNPIAQRLGKLGSLPVDLRRLEAGIRTAIPAEALHTGNVGGKWRRRNWAARIAVAASLVIGTGALFVGLLMAPGRAANASTRAFVQLYRQMLAGRVAVFRVNSIAAANQALAAPSPVLPKLARVSPAHVMACCTQSMHGAKVSCVLMKNASKRLTMFVAKASDMKLPRSPTVLWRGVTYHVERQGNITMLMVKRHGKWICLMGRTPAKKLLHMASRLRF